MIDINKKTQWNSKIKYYLKYNNIIIKTYILIYKIRIFINL